MYETDVASFSKVTYPPGSDTSFLQPLRLLRTCSIAESTRRVWWRLKTSECFSTRSTCSGPVSIHELVVLGWNLIRKSRGFEVPDPLAAVLETSNRVTSRHPCLTQPPQKRAGFTTAPSLGTLRLSTALFENRNPYTFFLPVPRHPLACGICSCTSSRSRTVARLLGPSNSASTSSC